jgi:hypothetical protein
VAPALLLTWTVPPPAALTPASARGESGGCCRPVTRGWGDAVGVVTSLGPFVPGAAGCLPTLPGGADGLGLGAPGFIVSPTVDPDGCADGVARPFCAARAS